MCQAAVTYLHSYTSYCTWRQEKNRASRSKPFRMSSLTGNTRLVFLAFFATHIPITLAMNGQTVLPEILFPSFMKELLPFYAEQVHDTLMMAPFETWFQAMVVCEVVLQVPFFIVAVYVLSMSENDKYVQQVGAGWFRTLCLIYSSHASTTLMPILACTMTNPFNTTSEKALLLAFYFPYLLFPLWLMYICATNTNILVKGDGGKTEKKN